MTYTKINNLTKNLTLARGLVILKQQSVKSLSWKAIVLYSAVFLWLIF